MSFALIAHPEVSPETPSALETAQLADQLAALQALEQLHDIFLKNIHRSVIFCGDSRDDLRDAGISVTKLPNSAADIVQRIIVSVVHIEEQKVVRCYLGDHLLHALGATFWFDHECGLRTGSIFRCYSLMILRKAGISSILVDDVSRPPKLLQTN